MTTRKALATWFSTKDCVLSPQLDVAYNRAVDGGVKIGNTVLPRAWDPVDVSGWWKRGSGQFEGFAVPITKEDYSDAVRAAKAKTEPSDPAWTDIDSRPDGGFPTAD